MSLFLLDHFTVNSNGVISNNKKLDADSNNAYYEFIVTAKDKGEPPRTGTATVRIYTENKNDEWPKFSQQVKRALKLLGCKSPHI